MCLTEEFVRQTRTSLQKTREAYSAAITQRSASQREVNELLQRKHAWSPNDLERFTALYRSDHENEQAETAAQENLAVKEREAEEAAGKLSKSILARYHEEQIWSDKIRRMSTWGTWGLMGVNVLLFLVFQIGVEPWRRKRLVKGFEDKVMEALEREGPIKTVLERKEAGNTGLVPGGDRILESMPALELEAEEAQTNVSQTLEPAVPTKTERITKPARTGDKPKHEIALVSEPIIPTSTLASLRENFRDMFSDRQITLRRVDLTTVALQGAAAGFALVGLVVIILRPK